MKILNTTCIGILLIASSFTTNTYASDDSNWFVRPILSLSNLSETSGQITTADGTGAADVSTDGGFSAGLGLGYQYNANVAVELFWEYRTNDSDTTLPNASVIGGNYASNVFYLNGFYYFDNAADSNWQTYVGAGLGWVQEIDIDLETAAGEESYSGDGQTGYQLFVGTQYELNNDWQLQLELRYGNISSIDMNNELSDLPFNGLDYSTTSLQLGLVYQF